MYLLSTSRYSLEYMPLPGPPAENESPPPSNTCESRGPPTKRNVGVLSFVTQNKNEKKMICCLARYTRLQYKERMNTLCSYVRHDYRTKIKILTRLQNRQKKRTHCVVWYTRSHGFYLNPSARRQTIMSGLFSLNNAGISIDLFVCPRNESGSRILLLLYLKHTGGHEEIVVPAANLEGHRYTGQLVLRDKKGGKGEA